MQQNKYIKTGAVLTLAWHLLICYFIEPILDNDFYKYCDILGCGYGLIIFIFAFMHYNSGITTIFWNLVFYCLGVAVFYHVPDAIYCTIVYANYAEDQANEILNKSSEIDNAVIVCVTMIAYTVLFCWFIRNRK